MVFLGDCCQRLCFISVLDIKKFSVLYNKSVKSNKRYLYIIIELNST